MNLTVSLCGVNPEKQYVSAFLGYTLIQCMGCPIIGQLKRIPTGQTIVWYIYGVFPQMAANGALL